MTTVSLLALPLRRAALAAGLGLLTANMIFAQETPPTVAREATTAD